VRECYRLKLRTMLPEGAEIVIIARTGAAELASANIRLELITGTGGLLRRLESALKSKPA
jgi:RNase P protein component